MNQSPPRNTTTLLRLQLPNPLQPPNPLRLQPPNPKPILPKLLNK
jgi:hypothetical protein